MYVKGAATAMFAAAEINNSLLQIRRHILSLEEPQLAIPGYSKWVDALKNEKYSESCAWLSEVGTEKKTPYVSCAAFGMPPCVSKV